MMTDREILIAAVGGAIVLLALAAMIALHERHYRGRTTQIQAARDSGSLDARLDTLERILAEDRLT